MTSPRSRRPFILARIVQATPGKELRIQMTAEERHPVLHEKLGGMVTEMEGWYADRLRAATLEELKALLAPVAKTLPVPA